MEKVNSHLVAPYLEAPPMCQALCWDESALDLGLPVVWGESGVIILPGKPMGYVGGQFGEVRPEEGFVY